MDDEKTLSAADELLAAAGMSTDDFAEGGESQAKPEESKEQVAAWQGEISKLKDELRQNQQTQQMQVMQALSQAVGQKQAPAPEKEDELSPEDKGALHKLALENPAVMEALIERNVGKALSVETKKIEERMASKMQRTNATDYLRSQVYALYGDEIKDQNSEIMRTLGTVQAKLRTMLDPSMHNTPEEAELAVLIAAGLNPKAVSKRQKSRDDAFEKTRSERLSRAAAMAGLGGREEREDGKFTDDELALFQEFGMDPEKDGDYIKEHKKRHRLSYLSGGRIVGEHK